MMYIVGEPFFLHLITEAIDVIQVASAVVWTPEVTLAPHGLFELPVVEGLVIRVIVPTVQVRYPVSQEPLDRIAGQVALCRRSQAAKV